MKRTLTILAAAAALCTASVASAAERKSPLFGSSAPKLMTAAQDKAVVGKGASADYYGYYGNLYSSYANYYGNYAYGLFGSTATNNYYYAYYYANQATSNYYNAYIYAYYGY